MSDPVAGSWEDLYERALEAAQRNDPEADALFDRLITRLNKLPERVLMAGDGHLVGLRDMATVHYANYLLDTGRIERALTAIDSPDLALQEVDPIGWHKLRAFVYAKGGRFDAAEYEWLALCEITAEIDDIQDAFFGLIAIKRFAAAAVVLRDVEEIGEDLAEFGDYDEYLPAIVMRMSLLASINRPEEARKVLAHLLKRADEGIDFLQGLLESGWSAGFTPEEILRILDMKRVPRTGNLAANFWRAFALQQLHRSDEARVFWAAVATDDVLHAIEHQPEDIWPWIIAQYYLGDPQSLGLAAALDVLREYGDSAPFTAFAAAAIGWARADDPDAAQLNLIMASTRFKRAFYGETRIVSPWRIFAQDLLTPEQFAPMEEYLAEREVIERQDITL